MQLELNRRQVVNAVGAQTFLAAVAEGRVQFDVQGGGIEFLPRAAKGRRADVHLHADLTRSECMHSSTAGLFAKLQHLYRVVAARRLSLLACFGFADYFSCPTVVSHAWSPRRVAGVRLYLQSGWFVAHTTHGKDERWIMMNWLRVALQKATWWHFSGADGFSRFSQHCLSQSAEIRKSSMRLGITNNSINHSWPHCFCVWQMRWFIGKITIASEACFASVCANFPGRSPSLVRNK